jgi:uncharacterized protein (TIGR03118 family)
MTRATRISIAATAACVTLVGAMSAQAAAFQALTLVTDDQAAHPGQVTDASLVNAWGLSYAPTGPFWASSNGGGVSTVYTVNPTTQSTSKAALTVSVPPGGGSVTGQVFNSGAGSGAFNGDNFLFVSEDGTVSGWRGALGANAETLQPASASNVYKGSAFATVSGSSYLYAANFRAGSVDVFKGSAAAPALAGNFTDPALPSGYAPFNVQNLAGTLYVTYALQDAARHDEISGAGLGFVDAFSTQGLFLGRIASQGTLNAPWGLAIAPSSFGALAGSLLVGNFGDGRINAYDAATHAFLSQISDGSGAALTVDGLWAITPGNGGSGGSASLLYFTAGPDGETHGLLGVLVPAPVPEPGTAGLLSVGAALLAFKRRGSRLHRASKPSAALG